MPDVLLPPLILELRAKAGEAIASMREVGAEAEKVGAKADVAQSRTSTAFNKLAGVGKAALLGVAGGAAAIGVESIKMAGDFQKETNVLVTAAGESAGGLKVVRAGIQDIAMQTGTTWQNLTEGMYQVEKAGYRGAAGLRVLRAAAQGAAEEGASMASVTNAMTSVMASYHLHASDSVRVMNALKTAAGEGKMTMEEFASSLSTVIPVASASHISFAQVGGAIATLTQHGTSAAEATQELSNTIRAMSAPNHVAIQAMQQLGLSANDLSSHLGSRGLTGTIEKIVTTIGAHMGKSGLVMVDAFKKSQAASSDLQIELGKMPPKLKGMAEQVLKGSMSYKDFNKASKGLGLSQYELAKSFLATAGQAMGFNNLLKSGSPAAATFAGYLKQVMGGATGMNTALMLSGENMAGFKDRVTKVAASYHHASKSVEGWASTQNLFSIQMARFRQMIDVLFIRIGTFLIPILQSAAAWFTHHIGVVELLAGVIGGALVIAITAYVGKMVWSAGKTVVSFAKQTAAAIKWAATNSKAFVSAVIDYVKYTAAGDTWLASQMTRFAESIAAGWAWVTEHAAMAATYIAENVAMAASATAAWVAENAATLGLIVVIGAVVAAVVWMATHWSQTWNAIKTVALDVWHALESAWQAVWGVIGPVLAAAYNGVIKPVFTALGKDWQLVWDGLRATLHALRLAWHDVWGAVQAVYHHVIEPVFGFIKDHWQLVVTLLTGGLGFLATHWQEVWGVVEAVWNRVIRPVFAFIGQAFNDIVRAGMTAYTFLVDKVIDPIGSAFSALWRGIQTVASGVAGIFSHFWDGLLSAGAHVFNWIATAWNDTLGKIHFTIPSWIPGIGGDGFGFPTIPLISGYASGGLVRDGLFMVGEHGPELMGKSGGQLRVLSNTATSGALSAGGSLAGGGSSDAGGEVLEAHVHVYLDGEQIQESLERGALRTGMRRGRSYTPYHRG